MTPDYALLTKLEERGVELSSDGQDLRYQARKGVMTPELRTAITEHKAAVLTILRYRTALHRCWALMAEAEQPEPTEAAQLLAEITTLVDDVGEPAATALRRRWEAAWWRERRACPRRGGSVLHDHLGRQSSVGS